MALLTKEAILKADDMKWEDVPVPEWGGTIRVRVLTGRERDLFDDSMVELKGKVRTMKLENIRARLVALSAIDEKGDRLFSDEDVLALGEKSALALDRVFDVCQRISGLREVDIQAMVKNSNATPSEGSTSG